MTNRKYVIGRPINGISLNGLEYLLDSDQAIMKFETEAGAISFLKSKGFKSDDFDAVVIQKEPSDEV